MKITDDNNWIVTKEDIERTKVETLDDGSIRFRPEGAVEPMTVAFGAICGIVNEPSVHLHFGDGDMVLTHTQCVALLEFLQQHADKFTSVEKAGDVQVWPLKRRED